MSADLAKVRKLLVAVRELAVHLTDEEISDIGMVLDKACTRLLREQGEEP